MELRIDNIGKFKSAQVKLNGITVICGENSTGKSTIGKILFSCFNSMCNFEEKIHEQRKTKLTTIFKRTLLTDNVQLIHISDLLRQYINFLESLDGNYNFKEMMRFWELYPNVIDATHKKEITYAAMEIMEKSNIDLFNEYIFRYFGSVFIGQVRNLNVTSNTKAEVNVNFREGTNTIRFYKNKCSLTHNVKIVHPAYYIDNPFIIDELNFMYPFSFGNEIKLNVFKAIKNAQMEQADDKMTDLFDIVSNKEKLKKIYNVLKKAYKGNTIISNGRYYYKDGDADVDFINLSTGLKSFALIERLLESGKLKQKDVLILDEPEIHLHPEWQLVYAETIVLLQKEFDLTVLITTHSPYFLEAIEKFTKKYDLMDTTAYYLAKNKDSFSEMIEATENLEKIYELMFTPMQKLENMEHGIYE